MTKQEFLTGREWRYSGDRPDVAYFFNLSSVQDADNMTEGTVYRNSQWYCSVKRVTTTHAICQFPTFGRLVAVRLPLEHCEVVGTTVWRRLGDGSLLRTQNAIAS